MYEYVFYNGNINYIAIKTLYIIIMLQIRLVNLRFSTNFLVIIHYIPFVRYNGTNKLNLL